jgi:hypothetical protein
MALKQAEKLTLQKALEQRDKLLLVHGDAFTVEQM